MIKSQSGFVTAEFLFAVIIAFGMTILTFAFTFTLSVVEVTQYALYSASRAHSAANYDKEAQQKQARTKYASLIQSQALGPLFNNGWFMVAKPDQIEIRSGDGTNFEREYAASSGNRHNMQGIRGFIVAKILEMRLPFIGNITPDDDGFKANLTAIMLREPSLKDCQEYMSQRADAVWSINGASKFRGAAGATIPWEDNGC